MMNDTVREEMQTQIKTGVIHHSEIKPVLASERTPLRPSPPMMPAAKRPETTGLGAPKTSPTLVEFQNKNASLPDWRLQLQNAVQQRRGVQNVGSDGANGIQYPANGGATALKAEVVQRPEPVPEPPISDPRVANAMRRIAESRKTFLGPEGAPKKGVKMRPFGVVMSSGAGASAPAAVRVNAPKPTLVTSAPPAGEKRDTNKLPNIATVQALSPETGEPVITAPESPTRPPEFAEIKRIRIRAEHPADEASDIPETFPDEIEDLAPFSMRFGAGLFDLIIGAFAAFLLLSPVAFSNGNWFTAQGLLTYAASFAVVTFLYMTACLGFFGKTMGMRLFSLELVDALENEYPTLRQAAVNSSVFLLSLPLAGAGFLTAFFNEEKRALHDLLSGTIIVRDF